MGEKKVWEIERRVLTLVGLGFVLVSVLSVAVHGFSLFVDGDFGDVLPPVLAVALRFFFFFGLIFVILFVPIFIAKVGRYLSGSRPPRGVAAITEQQSTVRNTDSTDAAAAD